MNAKERAESLVIEFMAQLFFNDFKLVGGMIISFDKEREELIKLVEDDLDRLIFLYKAKTGFSLLISDREKKEYPIKIVQCIKKLISEKILTP